MKVWIKLLIGAVLGVSFGFISSFDNQTMVSALAWLEEFAIRIGRYCLVPILVFSLTIAVYELRHEGQFWVLVFKTGLVIIVSSVFVISVGILATVLFPPARIPILIEEQVDVISLNTANNILEIFPSNMFAAIVSDGVYLLPVSVFAFFLGMWLSYDRNFSKPVIGLVDALSRIFYHIAAFFSEVLGLVMIILSAYWAVRFKDILRADVFR